MYDRSPRTKQWENGTTASGPPREWHHCGITEQWRVKMHQLQSTFMTPGRGYCVVFLGKTLYSHTGFVRVLENLESPGILLWHFPGLESPGKGLLVLESSGNLLNSSKKIWNVWQTVRWINIKILGVKGLMWILGSWKNQSESWKTGNLFLKKGTNPVTVPLSTQVYKWVPANLMVGVTLRWTSIPSRGE